MKLLQDQIEQLHAAQAAIGGRMLTLPELTDDALAASPLFQGDGMHDG
jgi:hypothetical protein